MLDNPVDYTCLFKCFFGTFNRRHWLTPWKYNLALKKLLHRMKNAVIFSIVFHIVILQAPGLANSPGASFLELIIPGFELIAKIAQKFS
jgi:hypothetical protein